MEKPTERGTTSRLPERPLYLRSPSRTLLTHCALLVVSLLCLASCSSESSGQPDQPGTSISQLPDSNPGTSIPVTTSTTQNTTATTQNDTPNSTSYVYFTDDRELFRVSAVTGNAELLFELPRGIDYRLPLDIVGDEVIVTMDDNTLNSIDANTGEFNWEFPLGSVTRGLPSAAVCASTVCYVLTSINEVVAYDIASLSLSWVMRVTDLDVDLPYRPMMVADDRIYITGEFVYQDTSTIMVLNRHTGAIEETLNLDGSVRSTPRIHNDNLIVPTQNSLLALNKTTLQTVWTTPFDGESRFFGTSPITIAGDVIALNSQVEDNGTFAIFPFDLVGVDANTGTILWSRPSGSADQFPFDPQSDDTTIYSAYTEFSGFGGFSRQAGAPYAVNATTGETLWETGDIAHDDPLVAAGHVYFSDIAIHRSGGTSFGFAGLNKLNGEVAIQSPNAPSGDVLGLTMTHNGTSFRQDPFPGFHQTQ